MAVLSDDEILRRLRKLYKDAHKLPYEPSDIEVLRWADHPELWAEQEIRHRGKSFFMTEAVVRNCRIMRSRAHRAVEAAAAAAAGTDPFDPLMPACATGNCPIPTQDEAP